MLNFMNHRSVKKLHLGYTSFAALNVMTEQGFWFTVLNFTFCLADSFPD